MKNAEYWIKKLNLAPLSGEGGYFKVVYKSDEIIDQSSLPERFTGNRSFSNSIYYLLKGRDFSAFHKLNQEEIWHFYEGLVTLIILGILNYILPETPVKGYITLIGIVLVVGFFAFGPGGVILVLCAELLPNRVRGIGLSIAFTIGGLVGMFFVSAFLPLSSIIGYSGLFFLIAFFVFCYVLISFTIPETKGKTLEEIEMEYKK
ncbi:MAG TPA: cupin domain-containing protein [Victivallales bacterium]|nr:cupin domain-containing protein [Victivallales bacterium]